MALRQASAGIAQRLSGRLACSELGIPTLLRADVVPADSPEQLGQVRHASNQAVKQRIRAIKNIGKITKAMKMVAASKMRNALVAVEESRGMVQPFTRLFGDHPAIESNKALMVSVTSDRGLCGGLNSNIAKYTRAMLSLYQGGTKEGTTLVTIGDKGRSQLGRTDSNLIAMSFADTYKAKVTFAQASIIAEEVLKQNPEAVRIVYNKFRSAISFKPSVATVLSAEAIDKQLTEAAGNKLDAYELDVTHEKGDALQDLAELQLATTLYNAMLENNCSEHASRMSAMENSTKSAGEMLSALTLAYNRTRQATITTELIEIIAGASALVDE
jgi:F-type H+-transporting ATPase subunit gamma